MKCRECQVEKYVAARGLCSTCYSKLNRKENAAVCEGCKEFKPIHAKGLCDKCYGRFQRHGDTSRERKKKGDTLCTYCNEKPMHAKGYCKGCYQRYRATGSPEYRRVPDICSAKGCKNRSVAHGLCEEHKHHQWTKRKAADSHLVRNFNITIEDYEQMLKDQNNVCAICGQAETKVYSGKVISLAVDHCHDTGAVRGLLCSKCNTALGGFNDSQEILEKAINYLNV